MVGREGSSASAAGTGGERRKVTPARVLGAKKTGRKLILVSAYDYPMARWADLAGVDMVFVSDAFGTVGLGRENSLSVTVDELVYHTRAVKAGAGQCLVLSSLPFMSYHKLDEAVTNAGRLLKEGGAEAIEIEGCRGIEETVAALVRVGIPTVGHIGLTRKTVSRLGSFRVQGRDAESALAIIQDALTLSTAGVFALILECIPDRLAQIITSLVDVPTIGFGAGVHCDGQGLISQDMLGLYDKFCPRFVKQFAHLSETTVEAFRTFAGEVQAGSFPGPEHSFTMEDQVLQELLSRVGRTP
jgi:3-methyl-2-oxobutanoate hydroxymethyltransferase